MQFLSSRPADARPRTLLFKWLPLTVAALATQTTPVAWAQSDPCLELIKNVRGVSAIDCRAAALKPTGARSVNGLPLLQREVHANEQSVSVIKNIAANPSTFAATLPPLKVLVLGGIHGDEMSSVALVFRWIALAQAQPAGIHWRFVPGLNPDGLLQSKPTRVNANKVDLNRNFPTPGWQHEAAEHWVNRTRKDPRRWPGNTAQSEPETRFVVQTMSQWKPDLIVSVHAPYAVLDFDGPVEAPQRLGKLFLDRVGIFPGSLGNYGGMHRNVPVVTLELPHANRIPPDDEVKQMWADLLKWTDQRLALAKVEPPKPTATPAAAAAATPALTTTITAPAPSAPAPVTPTPIPTPIPMATVPELREPAPAPPPAPAPAQVLEEAVKPTTAPQ
jgi:murein peptide amidase A